MDINKSTRHIKSLKNGNIFYNDLMNPILKKLELSFSEDDFFRVKCNNNKEYMVGCFRNKDANFDDIFYFLETIIPTLNIEQLHLYMHNEVYIVPRLPKSLKYIYTSHISYLYLCDIIQLIQNGGTIEFIDENWDQYIKTDNLQVVINDVNKRKLQDCDWFNNSPYHKLHYKNEHSFETLLEHSKRHGYIKFENVGINNVTYDTVIINNEVDFLYFWGPLQDPT